MRATQPTRILIVDDHPMFRKGIRWSLDNVGDFQVVGEATDGEEALQQAELLNPDVVVLDVSMPGESGIEVTRMLKHRYPQMGVVILTMHEDDENLFNAIRAGAAAFCTKDIKQAHLVDVIRRVAQGEYLINENVLSHPFVATRLLDQFRELEMLDQLTSADYSPLTPREVEILDQVARGSRNKDIATALTISDQTVKNHITSILRKLQVNDRTQAVIYALRHGWIKLNSDR